LRAPSGLSISEYACASRSTSGTSRFVTNAATTAAMAAIWRRVAVVMRQQENR